MNFFEKRQLINVLSKTLNNLTSQNNTHFKEVAEQIDTTRKALFALVGIDEKYLVTLAEEKESLEKTVEKLRNEIAELEKQSDNLIAEINVLEGLKEVQEFNNQNQEEQ